MKGRPPKGKPDTISLDREKLIRLLSDDRRYKNLKKVIGAIKSHPRLIKYQVGEEFINTLERTYIGEFTLSFLDEQISKLEG